FDKWFDPTAFVLPAQFTYAHSGANILREDSYKNLDFSAFKRFGNKVEFRAECFNLTNTPSFNAPNTAVHTSTAGRVTSTFSTPPASAVPPRPATTAPTSSPRCNPAATRSPPKPLAFSRSSARACSCR